MVKEIELEKEYRKFEKSDEIDLLNNEIELLKNKIEILKDTNEKLRELLGNIHDKTEGY